MAEELPRKRTPHAPKRPRQDEDNEGDLSSRSSPCTRGSCGSPSFVTPSRPPPQALNSASSSEAGSPEAEAEPPQRQPAARKENSPSSSSPPQRQPAAPLPAPRSGDRFLPTRSPHGPDSCSMLLPIPSSASKSSTLSSTGRSYVDRLQATIFGEVAGAQRSLLRFDRPAAQAKTRARTVHSDRAIALLGSSWQSAAGAAYRSRLHAAHAPVARHISHTPERILDAPDMLDDFYLNLLDWSCKDVIAVALRYIVYLWGAKMGKITMLCNVSDVGGDSISSVKFSADGQTLAVGTDSSEVRLYDVESMVLLRTMGGHCRRVSSLAWNSKLNLLSSGSRDATILSHDPREYRTTGELTGVHRQEWSPDGKNLASGSNDNTVKIWDSAKLDASRVQLFKAGSMDLSRLIFSEHTAAVKALAWHPTRRHLLATGGGTNDCTIRFWNTSLGQTPDRTCLRNTIETGSQVCTLLWAQHAPDEILSSHGFVSSGARDSNPLILWKYPQMTKVVELTGHTNRVLQLAASPDGRTVVSGSADETLRFWKVFAPLAGKESAAPTGPMRSSSVCCIR